MELCVCPEAVEIADLPQDDCPVNLGQVVRFIHIRSNGTIAATEAAAKLLATYTPLLAASDDTKIQVSPGLIEGLEIPGSTAITEGGDDNSTPLGRRILVGESTIWVDSPMIRNLSPAQITAWRTYRCENLDLAFINEFGQIGFRKDGLLMKGFPIHSFFVGSKGNAGKNTHDKNIINFGMDPDWANNLILVKPTDFDPRFNFG